MCLNNQFDPLFRGDVLLKYALFYKITENLMVWLP